MIAQFKINNIDPPNSILFSLERKVLVEKYRTFIPQSIGEFCYYKNTILVPGEFLYVIDYHSLVIERYVISITPRILVTSSTLYLFGRKGETHGVKISLTDYLHCVNNSGIYLYMSETGISGAKFICSSERNVLITLKNHIPIVCNFIQESLNKNNTSKYKVLGRNSRLKNLQKTHKNLVKFLKHN